MEMFEIVFWALILIWIVSRYLRPSKSNQPTPSDKQTAEPNTSSRKPAAGKNAVSIEDALKEIEEHLGEQTTQKEEPPPVPEKSPTPSPQPSAEKEEADFHWKKAPAEKAEPRRQPQVQSKYKNIDHKDLKDVGDKIPKPIVRRPRGRSAKQSAPSLKQSVKQRMRSRRALREAFLIKELLDPPVSQRPLRKSGK